MNRSKLLAVALAAAFILPLLLSLAWADGDRGTASEEEAYARREAASPGVEEFVGGSHALLVLLLLLLGCPCAAVAVAASCH